MLSNNNSINKIRHYFNYVIVAFYIVIGLAFIFTDIAIETFPGYREVVGGILLLYAAFRIFMIAKRNRNENEEA